MKKNKKIIIVTIFIIGLVAILILMPYLFAYKIDDSNLDFELGKYMNNNHVKVIDKGLLEVFDDNYLVVYSEMDRFFVVSLLRQGINNKYQILHSYQTLETISYINYEIELQPFNVIYGRNNDFISKLVFDKSNYLVSKELDNKDIFVIERGLLKRGSVEIVYKDERNELTVLPSKLEGTIYELTDKKKNLKIPILFLVFILFAFGYTLIISSGGEEKIFGSDVAIDGNNRLKKMKPW